MMKTRQQIRVVHVLHSFGTGGMENIIATVVRQASSGFKHIILCLTVAGDSTKLLPPGVELIELHKPPGNSISFIWALSRRLKNLKPDIVQSYNWSGMDAIIAARLAGIKIVVQSEHGWDMDDPDGLNPKRKRVRRFLSRWTKEITCVSKQMVSWLTEEVQVHSPVTHIYNGVDIDRYTPGDGGQIRQSFGLPPDSFVIGIVSRLDPIKDHPLLFRAFASLRMQRLDSYLLIVGDGPEKERLLSLSGENVYFLNNRPDVPNILRALDVFVLSSLNEGISCAITEAMASGLPVVATKVGGNPELVDNGHTGFLFAPGDEDGLFNCLLSYYDDRQMVKAHGEAGRNKMLDFFANEKMVKEYGQLYKRVLL